MVHLVRWGFTKIGGKWISKDGDQGGSSSCVQAEHEGEKQVVVAEGAGIDAQENEPTADFGVGPSVENIGDRITSMSPFERFMVNRMDNFAENQRNVHEYCATNFQNFDDRLQSMDARF